MTETKQIGLSFGCISPKLSAQLKSQKFKFDTKKMALFQKQVDAINMLRFGLLTDTMTDHLVGKLYKQIVSHVAKVNKFTINK